MGGTLSKCFVLHSENESHKNWNDYDFEEQNPNYVLKSNNHQLTQDDYIYLLESYHDSNHWFVPNCDRVTADAMLTGKPKGAFLVRESNKHKGNYVLAISLTYKVQQLLIYKNKDGFGLLGPGIHPTLTSLIIHYSFESLQKFDSNINTKLRIPYHQLAKYL